MPAWALTSISSNSPRLPVSRCASGSVNTARLAPASGIPEPNLAMPEIVYRLAGLAPSIVTLWPTRNPSLPAVWLSIATWFPLRGAWPSG